MRSKPLIWYEARVIFGLTAVIPFLILPVYGLISLLLVHYGDYQAPSLHQLIKVFEYFLPLTGALAGAHLMAVEREERFNELRTSYPEPAFRLPLLRTAGVLLLTGLASLIAFLTLRAGVVHLPLAEYVGPAVPPTLFLLGLTMLVSNLAGNYWVAAGTAMGYWGLEVITEGQFTRTLYLFLYSHPLSGVSLAVNRWLLVALGILLLLVNSWLHARRRLSAI